jgi:Protein of unknown function (DUF664)
MSDPCQDGRPSTGRGRGSIDTVAGMTPADQPGYPEPPATGSEVATLLGSLERLRATFAWKCAGLDAAGLRARVGASSVTLGGLLKHLAFMEDINFSRDLAGGDLPAPWSGRQWDPDRSWIWRSAADDAPEQLYTLWHDAVARSRSAVVKALTDGGLDHVSHTPGGEPQSLRRLLVDMIEEYGRHTGHADLIRESVDGRVGEDPPGRPYPYVDPHSGGSGRG